MFLSIENKSRKFHLQSILAILTIALLSYLPFANRWGFYRDDWHVLWGQNAIGFGNILLQHQIDRPLMGLVYMITSRILGNPPIAWALLAIALRLAGGIIVLLILEKMYTEARWTNTIMAALFTAYPGFLQVPNANSYHVHLIAFTSGLLSLYFTLILIERKKPLQRTLLFLVSTLSGILSYGMFEWMVGLELVRLILIAFRCSPRPSITGSLIKNIFRQSWPNLVSLLVFLVWRVFFFESTRSATDVGQLLRGYIASPGQSILTLGMELLKDLVNSIFLAWAVPFYQLVSKATYLNLALSIGLATLAVLIFWLVSAKDMVEPKLDYNWARTAVWVGGLSTLACLLPTVVAGRHIIFRDGLERYTLLASFGVIQFLTGWIVLILKNNKSKKILLLTLLASSIIVQDLNGITFGAFWEAQQQLWWQLTWRIPDLQDGAALIINMPNGAAFAEDYEVWGPANLIYRPDSPQVLIAGETFSKETIHKLMHGSKFGRTMRNVEYTGDMKNAVVVSYPAGSCVHIMDPEMPLYSLNDDLQAWLAASRSNPSMIKENTVDITPPEDIFGKEPPRGWCYFYQKIAMSVQFELWEQAAQYADEAQEKGLNPNDPAEWMPLYIAYAKTNNMDQTNELASILRNEPGLVENYCAAISKSSTSTSEFYVYNLCPELEYEK